MSCSERIWNSFYRIFCKNVGEYKLPTKQVLNAIYIYNYFIYVFIVVVIKMTTENYN